MPRKLAIIEIETGSEELCGDCHFSIEDDCVAFPGVPGRRYGLKLGWYRLDACLESTRLASLDRAVVEAAKALRDDDNSWPKEQALQAAVDERRKANG
ncbi:MAG TPA: hypothetical protein VGK73_14780 [Polyangiaceae bacterium]